MKFTRIEIYGFGKWVDQVFEFGDKNFISLYGENEAGKSTLQQFILYMLFGLPPRKLAQYKPNNSNKIGGKLTIVDQDIGQYTIERIDRECICILPSGEKVAEDWLQDQLQGLNRAVYESIYSFSAMDLEAIRQMDEADLSEVLFSVGLTGATNIYELEKQLDKETNELFKKTGKLPEINKQIQLVTELSSKVAQLKENESFYKEKIFTKKKYMTELERYEQRVKQIKLDIASYENIERETHTLNEYFQKQKQLQTYPQSIEFPEDGLNRLTDIQNNIYPLQSELTVLQTNIDTLKEEQLAIKNNLLSSEAIQYGNNLLRSKEAMLEREYHLKKIDQQLLMLTKELEQKLREIELTETYVEELSLPFHLETDFIQLKEQYQKIREEQTEIDLQLKQLKEVEKRLYDNKKLLESRQLSSKDLEQLEAKKLAFKISKNSMHQNGGQEVVSNWNKQRERTSKVIFSLSIVIALIAFVTSFFKYKPYMMTASVIVFLVGIIYLFTVKRSIKQFERFMAPENIDNQNEQITAEQYVQIEKQIKEQQQLLVHLQTNESELDRIRSECEKYTHKKMIVSKKDTEIFERKQSYEEKYPFLKPLKLVHWHEFLRMIRTTKGVIKEKQELQDQLDQLQLEHDKCIGKMKNFFKIIDKSQHTVTLYDVEKVMETNDQNEKALKTSEKKINEINERCLRIEQQINRYKEKISQLYMMASVDNEESFIERSNELERYNKLKDEIESLKMRMKHTFPEQMLKQLLNKEINIQTVPLHLTELKKMLHDKEIAITDLHKKIATIQTEIKNMESSDDYSKWSYQLEMEKEKLHELSKRWAILKVVQTAISKAKNAYIEKYMQAIIDKTSAYFNVLTNNAYVSVHAPTKSNGFQVKTNQHTGFYVHELSQGTIDQLYVALRFAINEVMRERYVVPLIIDDAFVHFDDNRLHQSMNVLKKIANNQQLFLFTCKKQIAEATNAYHIATHVLV